LSCPLIIHEWLCEYVLIKRVTKTNKVSNELTTAGQ
jgi:hypothetical protein